MLLRQTDGQLDPPIFAQHAGVPMRSLLRLCNVVRRTLGRLLLIFSNHPTLIVSWLELLARTVIFKMVSAFCMKLHIDYNMTVLFKNTELKNKTTACELWCQPLVPAPGEAHTPCTPWR